MTNPIALMTLPGWQPTCFLSLVFTGFAIYNELMNIPPAKLVDTTDIVGEYDFIIIGAGSAGAVIANRLSENDKWSVLLLEAGDQENDFSDIPLLPAFLQGSALDWKYLTEPPPNHEYCQAMNNFSCAWPRGKVVGGSSVLNYMLYVRGNKRDYDFWEYMGNTGWGYKDVLEYFKKSEDNNNPYLLKTDYHASGGYLSVEDLPWQTSLSDVFVKGGQYLGYKNRDINGKEQTGFMIPQGTIRDGRRCSTSKAFVVPVQFRPNLHLSMKSFVTKIMFEDVDAGQEPRATSVQFVKHNKRYTVKAKKEIIVSAGAVGSPQILMVSGIGPDEHLKELGIKLIKNLRVGYNLQDHVSVGTLVFGTSKPLTLLPAQVETPDIFKDYLLKQTGPLTTLGGVTGLAFVNSVYAHESGLYPDIQLHLLATSIFSGKPPFGKTFNLRPDQFNNSAFQPLPGENLFTLFPLLLRPKSRGRVKLRSRNPFLHPIIEPNYFQHEDDMKTLVSGMQFIMNLTLTPPFKEIEATPRAFPFSGCEKYELFSPSYFECCARHYTFTYYHPTSTCPMGIDANAVVDPSLRVHGVRNLRVIDASVMPTIVSGNTNAPTIMIAEKGADIIKQDWRKS